MSWKIREWSEDCSDKVGNECTHPARRRMACCESECPKNIDNQHTPVKLREDAEVLFEIEGNKIVSYEIDCFDKGFRVYWTGSKGIGSFFFSEKEFLDTEAMGRDFCSKFMKEIFTRSNVDYVEEE